MYACLINNLEKLQGRWRNPESDGRSVILWSEEKCRACDFHTKALDVRF